MFGLIEARNGRYGFRDLAAARQVAGLLAAGISAVGHHPEPARHPQVAARCAAVNVELFP